MKSSYTCAKAGFTLAEVLITLGIIGVVAAMTIPNLIMSYQKHLTVTKLQKAISILNQAYRLAYDDVGEVSPEEAMAMGSEEYFNTYWAPYLKVEIYCTDYEICGYDSNEPFKYLKGTNDPTALVWENHRTTFMTSDGFVYVDFVSGGNVVIANSMVMVDINGGKGPNVYGKDVFYLYKKVDGEKGGVVVPVGDTELSSIIDKGCSKTGSGSYCAEKIKRAGWKIDNSYPWK